MANKFYTNPAKFIQGDTIRPADVDAEFDALETAFNVAEIETERAIKLPDGAREITEDAMARANQVVGFDENGELQLQAGAGIFRGDWATGTLYSIRDIIADSTGALGQDNLYVANVEHVSAGSLITDAARWTLFVELEKVDTARVAAELAASNAATSETNAGNSETAAGLNETNSEDSNLESEDWANRPEDLLTRTFASGIGSSRPAGNYSATHHASKAEASATAALASEGLAATSASNASTSESNASTSASNANTSASSASTSEGNASTSESNALTYKNAAESAKTAAELAQAGAETALDDFDDRYLGSKAANPTLDNDGAALLDGALYWNTVAPELRVYDLGGTAWLSINNYTHPNHTGEVTSSGDGALTITENAVSLPKMAQIATSILLGRSTGGTGNVEALSAAVVRAILNIEDGATADQSAEEIQDIAGSLVSSGGTKTRITVVYDDISGNMDFIVDATDIAQGTRTTTTVPITSSTGAQAVLNIATASLAGVMSAADKSKLDAVEAGATADQTKADIDALNVDADTVDGQHASAFEPADGTILKDADIGSTVQAYDVDTAKTDVVQEWTKQQNYDYLALSYGATIDWNLDNPIAGVTLTGNATFNNPTNIKDGTYYTLRLTQDATGGRTIVLSSAFKVGDNGLPTLSTTANKTDYLTFIGKGTTELHFLNIQKGF